MSLLEIIILICSGLIVGFINTLAAGGTVISLSVLMFGMGLPADIANGTNRIAVTVQNLVAVGSFRKQKILDFKKGFQLAIPTIIGSVIGAIIAVDMNKHIMEMCIGIIMIVLIFFLIFNPKRWLKGKPALREKPIHPFIYFIFFLIGIYGGFVHVGVGYFLLAAIVLGCGFDLLKANAIKNFVVLAYTPFSLAVFMYEGKVNYQYGLVHSIGNVIGAYFASKYAVSWGANFIRWMIVMVIIFTSADLLGIIDIRGAIGGMMK